MGLIHTAAILSRETEKALFYHPRPRSEKFGSGARQVRESYFSLLRQNGCCVIKAHCCLPNANTLTKHYVSLFSQIRKRNFLGRVYPYFAKPLFKAYFPFLPVVRLFFRIELWGKMRE